MIIRTFERSAAPLLGSPTFPPHGLLGLFGTIPVLELTPSELRESFGIRIEDEVGSVSELVDMLEAPRLSGRIDHVRLRRLLRSREELLPCFVGFQDVKGLGKLPFLSDGVPGAWSLFFEPDGRMTLAERGDGRVLFKQERELVEPAKPLFFFFGTGWRRPAGPNWMPV